MQNMPNNQRTARAVIAIHGGAGAIARAHMADTEAHAYRQALHDILCAGQTVLARGGSACEAVTHAVSLLEDCPRFNAGHGAVFTRAGTHELDAAIMDGANLRSGAVAGVSHTKNPIQAARAVMESGQHVFFIGTGAENFARQAGLAMVDPTYFSTPTRYAQLMRVQRDMPNAAVLDHDGQAVLHARPAPLDDDKKLGTVGAVALDLHGNLAAATSTGGITNKQAGRVGDSPLIGAGTYANNASCAISTTGVGEMFIRLVAAYDVAAQMQYAQRTLAQAADYFVHHTLPSIGGQGGLIAVDAAGNIAMPFNTEGMYRGFARLGQAPVYAIYRGEMPQDSEAQI